MEEPPPAAQPARGSPAANSCGGSEANASQSSYFMVLTGPLLTGEEGKKEQKANSSVVTFLLTQELLLESLCMAHTAPLLCTPFKSYLA